MMFRMSQACRCRLIVRSNVGSADSTNFSLKGETSASFANADLDQSATQVIFQVATGRIFRGTTA